MGSTARPPILSPADANNVPDAARYVQPLAGVVIPAHSRRPAGSAPPTRPSVFRGMNRGSIITLRP